MELQPGDAVEVTWRRLTLDRNATAPGDCPPPMSFHTAVALPQPPLPTPQYRATRQRYDLGTTTPHTATGDLDIRGIVVFGGKSGDRVYHRGTYLLDLSSSDTYRWVKPRGANLMTGPENRGYHSAVMWGGRMYIYGGKVAKHELHAFYNDMWYLDVATWEWSQVRQNTKFVRAYHSATAYGDKMYVVGGHSANTWYDSMHTFDFVTNVWQEIVTATIMYPRAFTERYSMDERRMRPVDTCTVCVEAFGIAAGCCCPHLHPVSGVPTGAGPPRRFMPPMRDAHTAQLALGARDVPSLVVVGGELVRTFYDDVVEVELPPPSDANSGEIRVRQLWCGEIIGREVGHDPHTDRAAALSLLQARHDPPGLGRTASDNSVGVDSGASGPAEPYDGMGHRAYHMGWCSPCGRYVAAFGGYFYATDRFLNDVAVWDVSRCKWRNTVLSTASAPSPAPRASAACTTIVNSAGRSDVVLFGGDNGDEYFDDVHVCAVDYRYTLKDAVARAVVRATQEEADAIRSAAVPPSSR